MIENIIVDQKRNQKRNQKRKRIHFVDNIFANGKKKFVDMKLKEIRNNDDPPGVNIFGFTDISTEFWSDGN